MADNDAPSPNDELILQFSDVTGVTAERARFYLESANWTLQLALASFYEQDDNNPIDDVINQRMEEEAAAGIAGDRDAAGAGAAAAPASSSSAGRAPPVSFAGGSFSATSAGAAAAAAAAEKKKKKAAKSKPSSGPRIATIHNMGHSSSSSDDEDEEEGQAFYTGSERSGQQILGPPRRRGNDFVSEIFRSAQESGAEVVDPAQQQQPHQHSGGGAAGGSSRFGGAGYRLGQTDNDHVRLPDPAEASTSAGRGGRPAHIEPVVLKLWRQGFSINDGELRSYEEAANKEFLESIMKGEIPAELRQQGGHMVHVDLEDHRHEDFVRTVPKVRAFSGRGHTLGSPAPEVVGAASTTAVAAAAAASAADQAAAQTAADEQLAVNGNEPTTMIQVRLADGSRLSARFNHTHTIEDIRTYIATARVQYAGQNFALLSSYPSKELTDGTATISGAGLLNAALLQRLK